MHYFLRCDLKYGRPAADRAQSLGFTPLSFVLATRKMVQTNGIAAAAGRPRCIRRNINRPSVGGRF
jgi:hypothetical protein